MTVDYRLSGACRRFDDDVLAQEVDLFRVDARIHQYPVAGLSRVDRSLNSSLVLWNTNVRGQQRQWAEHKKAQRSLQIAA